MANYFGNTLTDLQSAVTAAERLKADQNIAQMGNAVRFMSGTQQALGQRDALQRQALMRQAELEAQRDIARGNQRTQLDVADLAARSRANLFQSESAESALDRASREKIAGLAAGRGAAMENAQGAQLIDAWNAAAETAANRYNTLWASERAARQLQIKQAQDRGLSVPFFNVFQPNDSTVNKAAADALAALDIVDFNDFQKRMTDDPDADKVFWDENSKRFMPKLRVNPFATQAPGGAHVGAVVPNFPNTNAPVATNYFRPTMGDLRMADAAAPPPVFGTPPQTNSVTNSGAVVPAFPNTNMPVNAPPASVTNGNQIAVRTSDGLLRNIRPDQWMALRAIDPGAQIVPASAPAIGQPAGWVRDSKPVFVGP